MALDGLSETEIEVIPLQDVAAAISELGSLVQSIGEADIAETVIVLTLTKADAGPKTILEVMFAGNPTHMEQMMKEGLVIIKELNTAAGKTIANAEFESQPWNVI